MYARGAIDRLFDGAGHQGFDLFGRQAGGFGLDIGLGRHEVGEDVIVRPGQRHCPGGKQDNSGQRDQTWVAQAKGDDGA